MSGGRWRVGGILISIADIQKTNRCIGPGTVEKYLIIDKNMCLDLDFGPLADAASEPERVPETASTSDTLKYY